jgi:ATP diphosphatase
MKVDPENALRKANDKFERRFRAMEALDSRFSQLGLDEQEALWSQVKERD